MKPWQRSLPLPRSLFPKQTHDPPIEKKTEGTNKNMAFTQQDNRSIDFICSLYSRAPNLNSAQILERCRVNFGSYPSMQVHNWLHKSLGEHQRAQDEVEWRRGVQIAVPVPTPAPEASQ